VSWDILIDMLRWHLCKAGWKQARGTSVDDPSGCGEPLTHAGRRLYVGPYDNLPRDIASAILQELQVALDKRMPK
jgi:hypothetical protein